MRSRRSSVLLLAIGSMAVLSGCYKIDGVSEGKVAERQETDELARKFIEEAGLRWQFHRGPGITPDSVGPQIVKMQIEPIRLRRSTITLLRQAPERLDRCIAAALLGALQDKNGIDALAAARQSDPEEDVRWEACWALGYLGPDAKAEIALLKALDDKADRVRHRAIIELSDEPEYRPLDEFRRVMRNDKSAEVRVRAAIALADKGQLDDAVVAFFQGGLADAEIRAICEERLEKLGLLKLPLADECYEPITPQRYRALLFEAANPQGRRSAQIERSVVKGDKIYFEVIVTEFFDPAMFPYKERSWYVVPVEKKN